MKRDKSTIAVNVLFGIALALLIYVLAQAACDGYEKFKKVQPRVGMVKESR